MLVRFQLRRTSMNPAEERRLPARPLGRSTINRHRHAPSTVTTAISQRMFCQLNIVTRTPLPAARMPPKGTPVCFVLMAVARYSRGNHCRTPFAVAGLVKERSEEHTSELQSLRRISYDVFGWKKKKTKHE